MRMPVHFVEKNNQSPLSAMTAASLSPAVMHESAKILMLFALMASAASSFASSELVLQLETSLTSDSNPLRFYEGSAALAQNGNTDTADKVRGIDLRAGAVIPVLSDRTRLILTGTLGKHSYRHYDNLDHQSKAGDAMFDYAIGDIVSGRINAGKEDRLFQYINGSLTDKDMSHYSQQAAELTLKITDELAIPVKTERSSLRYDLGVNQLYNFHQQAQQASIRYYSPTGSNIEAGLRLSETDYPNRNQQQFADLDKHYRETESFLEAEWKYSVKTVASTHLGLIRRRYESLHELDTNLFSTLIRATYFYSPKLRLDMQLWNRPFSIVDPSILYVIAKAARLDAQWKISDKTQFNFSGLLQDSDQKLVPRLAEFQNQLSRKEREIRLGFGMSYEIDRGLKLSIDSVAEKLTRDGNLPGLRQAIIKVGLEYTYENLPGSAAKMGLKRYQHSLSNSDALR
ncbi:hypothetical protein LPB67_06400 [Undibacterium sp. Jales W-56]|uniref:hypothetical protein n=1 Tax=Undibacterium sp. Jales W-56 TaxID=2897325 RepID=UPI0021D0F376|nr:hypothetical protein [Undibacterium sp. Jales W-56]MCU6433410.1 hypothetical protein [Undibacterium sp. Jales W-56]